jgi:DNA-binding transcriptional ArsR family regulator
MLHQPNVAAVAALIADPARAAILAALLDGRARPAGELAYAAGVTAQTASSHLAKLLDGGLIAVETEGRHRYYRLAGDHVSQVLEMLASIQPPGPVRRKALTPEARRLRFARCCYDHLAGRLGVAVADALIERRIIVAAPDKLFEVTAAGRSWFAGIGLDTAAIASTRRGIARQCLDWTERTHHVGGPLGIQLMTILCRHKWLRRASDSRAVHVTPDGQRELKRRLGIELSPLRAESEDSKRS